MNQNLVMTLGGGFFGGILIGYALKKVIKILSIVVGLFLAGLAYLQYQQIAKINWDKLQSVSQGAISNLANATTQISNNIGGDHDHTTSYSNGKRWDSTNWQYGNRLCGWFYERLDYFYIIYRNSI